MLLLKMFSILPAVISVSNWPLRDSLAIICLLQYVWCRRWPRASPARRPTPPWTSAAPPSPLYCVQCLLLCPVNTLRLHKLLRKSRKGLRHHFGKHTKWPLALLPPCDIKNGNPSAYLRFGKYFQVICSYEILVLSPIFIITFQIRMLY